jgi:hypothetical protein
MISEGARLSGPGVCKAIVVCWGGKGGCRAVVMEAGSLKGPGPAAVTAWTRKW